MLDGKSHASTQVHAVAWAHTMACTEPEPLSRPGRLQDVLICGWGDSTFMVALLHSMDAELPRGSQVTVLNLRPKEEVLGAPAQLPNRPAELTYWPALARALAACGAVHVVIQLPPAQQMPTKGSQFFPRCTHWLAGPEDDCR